MLILPIKVDTTDAQQAVKEWINKAEQAANETSKIAETLNKVNLRDITERAVDSIGDLKDIFEKTGKSVFGFSQETIDAAVASGDLAEKGASLLSFLGPYGAALGAVGGALLGYIGYTGDATEKNKELALAAKAARLEIDQQARSMRRLVASEVNDLAGALVELADTENMLAESSGKFSKKILEQASNEFTVTEEQLKKAQSNLKAAEKAINDITYQRFENETDRKIALTKAQNTLEDAQLEASKLAQKSAADIERVNAVLNTYTSTVNSNTTSIEKNIEVGESWIDSVVRQRKEIEAINEKLKQRRELEETTRIDRTVVGAEDPSRFERNRFESATIIDDLEKKRRDEATEEFKKDLQERADAYEGYFSLVSGFLGNFTAQLEENIAQGNGLFEGMGLAAQRGVAEVLKALGKKWGAEAISELAAGFAALATPGMRQDAPGHFTSAALYGSAAAAAGIAGAAVGGSAARQAGEQQGSTGGVQSPRLTDPGTQNLGTINYYSGGGPGSTNIFAGESEREKQKARKELEGILNVGKPK